MTQGYSNYFVAEDGEVQSQSESDGVGGLEFLVGDVGGLLVGDFGLLAGVVVLGLDGVLGDISLVVALHLEEEDLAARIVAGVQNIHFNQVEDVLAEVVQFLLDLLLVALEQAQVLATLRLLLLLDGAQRTPGGSKSNKIPAGTHRVFIGHRQQVSLLVVKLRPELHNLLHVLQHVLEALGLLGNS